MEASRTAVVWYSDGETINGHTYADAIATHLRNDGYQVLLRDLRTPNPDFPVADLTVLSGGSTPVHTDGWMPTGLRTVAYLMEQAAKQETRLLGICLGSQMIASVLAGTEAVGPAPGLAAGLAIIDWHGHGPVVVPSFNYHRIDANPLRTVGGVVLAGNDHSPVQAYAYGPYIRGVQFHPEFTPDLIRQVLLHNQGWFPTVAADLSVTMATVDDLEDRWVDRSLTEWLALLFEPDPLLR